MNNQENTHRVMSNELNKLDSWEKDMISEFRDRMLNTEAAFPCIFGVGATLKGTLYYGFIHQNPDNQAIALAEILKEFTDMAPSLGNRTSLIAFFKNTPPTKNHDVIHDWFWNLLYKTTQLDPKPWPEEISPKPDTATFEWSFNGQPMFIVVNTPLHSKRKSRQFSTIMITFQPRFVFDDLAEGTEKGDSSRKIIRERLRKYDSIPMTPFLGSYGDPDNREWIQYYLDDSDTPDITKQCPVKNFIKE